MKKVKNSNLKGAAADRKNKKIPGKNKVQSVKTESIKKINVKPAKAKNDQKKHSSSK